MAATPTVLPDNPGWFIALLVAILGAGPFWRFLEKRMESKRSPPAQMADADAGLTNAATAFIEALGNSWSKHTDELRNEIRKLSAAVEACEAHRAEDERRYQAARAELAEVREQLAVMRVAGQLPPYQPGDPAANTPKL